MAIDLQKDAGAVRNLLRKAVAKYTKSSLTKSSAKRYPPVSRIDLTYWLGDGGPEAPFIMLEIDTRPGAMPDGKYSHAEFAVLERPAWRSAINGLFDGKTTSAVLLSGDTKKLTENNLTKIIGDFLVAVLKGAKKDGLWAELPKLPECEFGVEESGGGFGWPPYDKRGRVNAA
jgi:hypothetical protein